MVKKSTELIVTALCTGAALIGLFFYKRYAGPVDAYELMLYFSAAILCISPVVRGLNCCKIRQNKAPNAG
jgi:hypothetical protein